MIRSMTEPRYDDPNERPSRLGQVAATVGIIAGVVFVVAVVFFSGVLLGGYYGGYGGFDGRSVYQMGPGGKAGACPMMGRDGMMGPRQMSPGGMMGPTVLPPTPTPGMPSP
ncbi:hypothetical protein BST25_03525 [Mycobacterium heidelbergense]|uniref:Uncharacterized protein n=2 Tax=Mycobacterium heidelbergense TaxID=53376 RepID=A0A1X0DUI3_MYCHE|nr:hypothetical protein BST25_03525 [Mycobacterium heidelbergense]